MAGLVLLLNLVCVAAGQNLTQEQGFNARRTLSIGYIIFPGFEPLDVYGPLEILFEACVPLCDPCLDVSLSYNYKMTLATIAHTTGPISSRIPPQRMDDNDSSSPRDDFGFMLGPSMLATHTFEDAPALDVIIVPGGLGNSALIQANDTAIESFIARRFTAADYVLSVCTGAVSLARAGVLSAWATSYGDNVTWVPSARWVEDGKVWTSSGVAAGMDMTYAFLKHLYGTEMLDAVMNGIEYAPHVDPHWDPFSVVHDVPGADKNRSLGDCIAPVGYAATCS
ncbi:class I glutamine amidotransferase-like protein [Phialemonium atrogriseum]|uniref:Class I glutamine amidotransferase-like protein n=1 Tax=Phialemonium atrogriseum TaxID=1093897 RepID=A0AAJ0BRP6_9PEZI|nr:class I glutamine amidotransferase-like protein [Phialemonium atrogriseum]KAK1763051.1 class I glutamine amidotransferase-like protein [Phialemonium atrogriseum]